MIPADLDAVVLCGGRGTRAWPLTDELPKPLLPVGDRPVLEHLVQVYGRQGVTRVILATGFRGDLITEWARRVSTPALTVTAVDTGEDSGTGERVLRCAELVGPTFFVTYGDGLGNVDLTALLAAHRSRPEVRATLTTVPLPCPYGTVDLDAHDAVLGFREKPVLQDHLINAGFFVFERSALDEWAGPDLEADVLPALARRGQLQAYRHEGFWKSMDTQKDVVEMGRLATTGGSPWLH